MKSYTVKQIAFNKEEDNMPNELGWDGAIAKSPKWKAYMDYSRFHHEDSSFNPEDIQFYHDKFLVQAESLDHVFHLTNIWNDLEKVHIYEQGHSTSVGDIIIDNETNQHYIVAGFGFNEIKVAA